MAFLAVVAIVVSRVIYNFNNDLMVFTSVMNNINIMLISTIATLIGLYVTAFIFLNDSLKARVKEDSTIGDAVRSILDVYRKNMVIIALLSIGAIVLEVFLNLVLDNPGSQSAEQVKLSLVDVRWILFILLSACSIFIIIWIILCSRDITNSDMLIFRYSQNNRDEMKAIILKAYSRLEKEAKDERTDNDKAGGERQNNNFEEIDLTAQNVEKINAILNNFAHKTYSLGSAYNKALKDGDIIIGAVKQIEEKDYGRYEIEFGKIVRLLEDLVERISDNNIDKSIMNNDYKNDSIENGFMWLFAQQPGMVGRKSNDDQSDEEIHESQKKERKHTGNTIIDVRDEKRFLDQVKYQIITHATFERRPFNNSEVEKVFERVVMAYNAKSFTEKRDFIDDYKENSGKIIADFFEGYKAVVGYRDAMMHLTRFEGKVKDTGNSRGTLGKKDEKEEGKKQRLKNEKPNKRIDQDIIVIINYARVLKRVLLDRFMSFVKTDTLSLGNSTLDKGWFNYSELSDSNFTHSSFKYACMENAILRKCDLSTCSFVLTDASHTDFSKSNFSYSDLTGMDLSEAVLNGAQMNAVIFRDSRLDSYYTGLSDLMGEKRADPMKSRNATFGTWVDKWTCKHWLTEIVQNDKRKEYLSNLDDIDDENERNKIYCDELRSGDYIKKCTNLILGDSLRTDSSKDDKDDVDVSILTYKDNQVSGTIFDGLYGKVKDFLESFMDYRRYTKINKELFDRLDEFRQDEYSRKEDASAENCKILRETNKGKVYFRVAVLKYASINNVSLPGTDFSFIDMTSASFKDSDLSGAEMHHVCASKTMFEKANLTEVDAYDTNFSNANFNNANLIDSRFVDCNFNNVNMKNALMLGCYIIKSDDAYSDEFKKNNSFSNPTYLANLLRNKHLNREDGEDEKRLFSELETVKMTAHIDCLSKENGYTCFDSDFSSVLASNITIFNQNMTRSKFIRADLTNAIIFNSVFIYSDMSECNLTNAVAVGNSFHQADCKNINMQRADIYACEFSNANLMSASLNSALLKKCLFDQANLKNVNFSRATISNCSFVKCNFVGVNLAGVRFVNCIFCEMDFSTAIGLDEAIFENCVFGYANQIRSEQTYCLDKNKSIYLNRVDGDLNSLTRYSNN